MKVIEEDKLLLEILKFDLKELKEFCFFALSLIDLEIGKEFVCFTIDKFPIGCIKKLKEDWIDIILNDRTYDQTLIIGHNERRIITAAYLLVRNKLSIF